MAQSAIRYCPHCDKPMVFALPSGGRGQRAFKCLDCDLPDPLESDVTKRWLEGELGRDMRR
jgi:hypothetical protein